MRPLPDPAQRLGPLPRRLHAVGFSARKRPYLRLCLPNNDLLFVDRLDAVSPGEALVVWGTRQDGPALADYSLVLRVEDGFLRSVGLGADLIRPLSWVIDRRGIYFDPRHCSDLEHQLAHGQVSASLAEQASRLCASIVSAGLTKYNVGTAGWRRPRVGSRKVILVPGQVESDASLVCGATDVRTNIGLLQRVRCSEPDAHVVYKPHPDVLAGLRASGAGEDGARRWCDQIVANVGMEAMLDGVDELNVMTSLSGFEALLRGIPVVCHGQPFYAGWGLTHDTQSLPRRSRRLALPELIVGALMVYPFYFSRDGKHLVTPQEAVQELIQWKRNSGAGPAWWREVSRVVLRQVVGVR